MASRGSRPATRSSCSPGWTAPTATSCASTRSADRPNPIGLHQIRIVEIDGARVRVRDLEALDGTPIVDVKPVI